MSHRRGHRAGWVAVLCFAMSGSAAAMDWAPWSSPAQLARIDPRDRVLEVSSRCPDGCRYDRSNAGPESPTVNPWPLRWLRQDGAEAVLFDQRGAGVVTRIWLTSGDGVARCLDPAMRVRFYVDGAALPIIDTPLANLFDGSLAPFTPPLVADRFASAGGYVSRVPMAYQSGLRITLVDWHNGNNPCVAPVFDGWNPLWYQIHFHSLPPGSIASSFDPVETFAAFRDFLSHAGDDPWNGLLAPTPLSATIAASTTTTVANVVGSGWLRGIRLALPIADRARVRLRVVVDGASRIDLPLADFFASAASAEIDARSVLTGVDSGGTLYAWWPMPYRQSLLLQLVGDAALPGTVGISGSLHFDPSPVPADAGVFGATLREQCVAHGDLLLHEAQGSGKLVGISARQRADGIAHQGYLEGDERALVDGSPTPLWYGTGVEDFYEGGFYFNIGGIGATGFTQPLAGATEIDRTGAQTTATYRLMLTDPLQWGSRMRLTQEAGDTPYPSGGIPTCLRHVVYAYTSPSVDSVRYAAFDVGSPAADFHGYAATAATCAALTARFDDEPATQATGVVCRGDGQRAFRFVVDPGDQPLRLRRTLDVGNGSLGTVAGSGAARIRINGVDAGWFSPVAADPLRRWHQHEAALQLAVPGDGVLDVEVIPSPDAASADFSDAGYELIGRWRDVIFRDGFDASAVAGADH